jgi:hypothetical protein
VTLTSTLVFPARSDFAVPRAYTVDVLGLEVVARGVRDGDVREVDELDRAAARRDRAPASGDQHPTGDSAQRASGSGCRLLH